MDFVNSLQEKILEELKPSHPLFYDKYISGKNIFILLRTEDKEIFEKYKYVGSRIFVYECKVEVNGV